MSQLKLYPNPILWMAETYLRAMPTREEPRLTEPFRFSASHEAEILGARDARGKGLSRARTRSTLSAAGGESYLLTGADLTFSQRGN